MSFFLLNLAYAGKLNIFIIIIIICIRNLYYCRKSSRVYCVYMSRNDIFRLVALDLFNHEHTVKNA